MSTRPPERVNDTSALLDAWRRVVGLEQWIGEDLLRALLTRFTRHIVLDPGFLTSERRPVIYCANQQTVLESYLFNFSATCLTGIPMQILAATYVADYWHARLATHLYGHPRLRMDLRVRWFQKADKLSLLDHLEHFAVGLKRGESLLVHVEGTRQLSCREPITRLSSTIIDLAIRTETPIVPVRFSGGLPVEAGVKMEYPVGFGTQDYHVGRPISPRTLQCMLYPDRRRCVLAAINALGPGHENQAPHAPDPRFAGRVDTWVGRTGCEQEFAAILCALQEFEGPCAETQRLLRALDSGVLQLPDDAEGRWLGVLAGWLFGPRGPAVVVQSA